MQYIGWYNLVGEGMRYFFSIELDRPYTSIGGRQVSRLFLYTSTGANTGAKCRLTPCALPCFGVVNYIRDASVPGVSGHPSLNDNHDISNKELQCNIVKSDYFASTKWYVTKLYGEQEYQRLKNTYFGERIRDELMEAYFGNDYRTDRNHPSYNDFKAKMGCNLFMENVLRYKSQIIDMVARLNSMPDNTRPGKLAFLSSINNYIQRDTFFGTNISRIARIRDLPFDIVATQFRTSVENVGILLDRFNVRNRMDTSRYNSLMDSPYISTVQDTAYSELLQGRPTTGLVA